MAQDAPPEPYLHTTTNIHLHGSAVLQTVHGLGWGTLVIGARPSTANGSHLPDLTLVVETVDDDTDRQVDVGLTLDLAGVDALIDRLTGLRQQMAGAS